MLTPGLESLIGKGIAQYKTFTFGTSGVSRIPVPKGSFIIIVDFDYFHFIDNPETVAATPAVSTVSWTTEEEITDITYQLDGIPAVPPTITFDVADPLQAQSDFQAFLNANLPGFTCSVILITLTNVVNATGPAVPLGGDLFEYTLTGDDASTYAGGIDTAALVWDGTMLTPVANQWIWLGTMTDNGDGTYTLIADLQDGVTAEVIGTVTGTFNSNTNTVTVVITEVTGYQWGLEVTTSTPGTAYNGLVPDVTFDPAPSISSQSEFSGGSEISTTVANVLENSVHQLEFRSGKSRNHYIIFENLEIFHWDAVTGMPDFFYNVKGVYQRNCYLVHTEPVQIDIIKVPVPETWIVDYGRLGQISQEASLPVGYGQNPGGLNAVKEVIFNGVIPGESYKPQTPQFTEQLNGAAQDQFKLNVSAGRELANPVDPLPANGNGRNYPLINIGYVLINMDYNDYVKSS